MLCLRTFGGLSLAAMNGAGLPSGAAAQRRPLALLAVLAAAGERGVGRDQLLLFLWPESDLEHARGALKQTLYRLRRDLGAPEVVVGTTELRLNSMVISSDVGEFEAALARGDFAHAVELYRGPFLEGVHLSNAPEFERWLERERERLANAYTGALQRLAKEEEARGNPSAAAEWWRRLAAHDPFSSSTALRLMHALDAAGDRAAAIRHAAVHAAMLREELGVEPDPAILALADRLRTEPLAALSPSETDEASAREGSEAGAEHVENADYHQAPIVPPVSDAEVVAQPALAEAGAAADPSRGQPGARPVRMPWRRAALLILLAALAGGAWIAWESRTLAGAPLPQDRVAVLPFSVRGSDEFAYLREGMVDLLSARLSGAGSLRGVDPHALLDVAARQRDSVFDPKDGQDVAREVGAGRFVLGEIVEAGEKLHISATLYDAQRRRVLADASVEGEPTGLTDLVDQLAARLLAGLHEEPVQRLARTAALTTRSLPALKAYLEGESEFRAGRYATAADAFQRAVTEDTSFALAYYRLSVAAEWASRGEIAESAAAEAAERIERLEEHDRQLLLALLAQRRGNLADAERRYRALTTAYPDDIEAWYQLGEILFHSGPVRGRSISEAREPYERVLHFEPRNREVLTHLLRIAAGEGQEAEVNALARRILALGPATGDEQVRAFRAMAAGSAAEQEASLRLLEHRDDETVFTAARHAAVYTENFAGAQRLALLLAPPARGVPYRVMGHGMAADLAIAQGQWRNAQEWLAAYEGLNPSWTPVVRGLYFALPFVSVPDSALLALRRELERSVPDRVQEAQAAYGYIGWCRGLRPYVLGLLSVRLREFVAAEGYARATHSAEADSATGTRPNCGLASTISAEVARAQGRPAEALVLLDATQPQMGFGALGTVLGSQAYQRYLRGELLRELGRYQEALRWYATLGQLSTHEVVYLAPAHLRQGEIYEWLGDRRRAIEHYTRAAELWKEADPELRAVVWEAEHRLGRRSGSR